jgi:hypothetical protein
MASSANFFLLLLPVDSADFALAFAFCFGSAMVSSFFFWVP